jgi:hypothetical protein
MPRGADTQPDQNVESIRECATDDSIRLATFAVAELGLPGLFRTGRDETNVAVIWQTMITAIAKQYQVPLPSDTTEEIVTAALSSVAPYVLGSKAIGWTMTGVLSALSGTVIPAATAVNTVLDIVFTYRLGKECVRRFAEPGFARSTEIDFGRRLVAPPAVAEVGAIGRLLANRGRPAHSSRHLIHRRSLWKPDDDWSIRLRRWAPIRRVRK